MRFGVLGAGAIGGFLGARLAHAGFDVVLIARGAHLEAMRSRGLRVREPDGSELAVQPACTDDMTAALDADVTFVTLKANSLPDLAPRLGGTSTLVFAQNGIPWWYFAGSDRRLESVDPGGVIAANVDLSRVVGCVAYPAVALLEPGVISHLEGNRFSLAAPDGNPSERVAAISSALSRAGLKAPVQARLRQELWLKLIGNATLNPVSALTRGTLGEILNDALTRELVRSLMFEVQAVGGALGMEFEIGVDRRLEGAARVPEHRTSMLQDVESGRPLEVEALVGSVVELGHQLEVATPGLEVVYRLVRQLERSRSR